jgi:hypothetical protein
VPGNHLKDLVAEYYQIQVIFVRRNVQVGKLPQEFRGHHTQFLTLGVALP